MDDSEKNEVKVTGVSIPFMDLVVLFVRAGVAAIPALFLIGLVLFVLWTVLMALT